MNNVFKAFVYSFSFLVTILFIVLLILFPWDLALILALIISFIFSCFFMGFTVRTLRSVKIEINASNKHPERNMKWYESRIREQINDMRFDFKEKSGDIEVFKPRTLYKVYEPDIKLEITPYYIEVEASRLMIRLIGTYIEITPEE